MRTGTKIAIGSITFICGCIGFLLIGVPLLSIKYPHIAEYFAPNLSAIVTSLTGGGLLTHAITEIRKAFENTKKGDSNEKTLE